MTLFFKSRTLARAFKTTTGKVVDHGPTAASGRRWGVQMKKAS